MNPPPGQLADLRFSVVGPGRVGSSLATWAVACGAHCIEIAGRGSDTATPARNLAARLGARATNLQALEPRNADLLFLAVPDRELARVVQVVAGSSAGAPASVVLHTSGSQTAAALIPLAAIGMAIGSLHPLRAFDEASPDLASARGTFFALDGDPAAEALARRLVEAWGGTAAVVPPEMRLLYHFAATLAAGGVATVLAAVVELAQELHLPAAAVAGYHRLAHSAIAAIERAPRPADAITGPLARGDAALVRTELQALAAWNPQLSPLAIALARETLRQLARQRTPAPELQELERDLSKQ